MLAQLLTDIDPKLVTVILAVGAHYLALRDRLVRIETKLDAHDKDLDAFGRMLETERSRGLAPK
jgi:hypothetical protein